MNWPNYAPRKTAVKRQKAIDAQHPPPTTAYLKEQFYEMFVKQ